MQKFIGNAFFKKRLGKLRITNLRQFKMIIQQNFAFRGAEQVTLLTCRLTAGGQLTSALKIS